MGMLFWQEGKIETELKNWVIDVATAFDEVL